MPGRPPRGGQFNKGIVACNTARVSVCVTRKEGVGGHVFLFICFSLSLWGVVRNFQLPLVSGPLAFSLLTQRIDCWGLGKLAHDGDLSGAGMLRRPLPLCQLPRRSERERTGISITG